MKRLSVEELVRRPKRYALVDTSILLLLAEGVSALDQLEESGCRCVITPKVLEELQRHVRRGGKRGRAARLALEVIGNRCYFLEVDSNAKRADDELVEISTRYRVPVATADLKLRKKLLRRVPTFYYRENQRRIVSDDYYG